MSHSRPHRTAGPRRTAGRERTELMRKTIAMFVVGLGCVLTGCTVGPKYHPPAITPPPAYKESPENFKENIPWTVAQPQDSKIRGDWWTIFNDPELNALEGQLNIDNQNIKVFFENFMEARAIVGEERALYFPTLSVVPSFNRQKSSGNLVASTTANTGRTSQVYSLPFDASWAPDLWGRVRNAVHAAQYSAQLSAADLENERLTEQAALATFFFEIRGQDALISLFADTVAQDQKALDLTQAQYDTGVGAYISVVEARNTLQTVQAQETNLRIARAQDEHAIAMLIGKTPSEFSIPVRPLTTAPPPIPLGMPSQLLERRPDVAAAERNMANANAQIGEAYAAFYPNLTLTAAGGSQSSQLAHLLDWPRRVWSLGGSAAQPLIQFGLTAARNQFVALYNANVATYRQTVLTAFQQVEDSLSSTRILSSQIEQEKEVVTSSQQALDLEMSRYQTGVDPYIDVVTLQNTLLTNQQTLTSLQVTQMTSAIALVQALGGGWDRSQLPTPSQVTQTPSKADMAIQH
jgi:NodT family efflux transporter outer membrane factor (OMF) lipoprotein